MRGGPALALVLAACAPVASSRREPPAGSGPAPTAGPEAGPAGGGGTTAPPPPTSTARPEPTATGTGAPTLGSLAQACRADGDCVVSDFEGCCGCGSCRAPYATSREVDRAARARCAVVDCEIGPCRPAVQCPPAPAPGELSARCEAGACVLVAARPSPFR